MNHTSRLTTAVFHTARTANRSLCSGRLPVNCNVRNIIKTMNDLKIINTLQRMKLLFIGFVVLAPLGIFISVSLSYQPLGIILFSLGGISAIVCAFTTCPCCGNLSGVFFKFFFGGVFPVGMCVHCKTSYINIKGCKK